MAPARVEVVGSSPTEVQLHEGLASQMGGSLNHRLDNGKRTVDNIRRQPRGFEASAANASPSTTTCSGFARGRY